jgi:arabinogalactan oligomer/maltooligosaccharide transport system permease protein
VTPLWRGLTLSAVGLVALATLVASTHDSAAAQDETLVLWHAYGESEERGLRAAVDAYRALHPEVRVDVVPSPFAAYATKLRQAIPAGNGPDLFIDAHDRLPSYVESGLCDPLTDAPIEEAALREALTLNGATYGVPLQWKSVALFVNDSLAAGRDLSTLEAIEAARPALADGTYALAWEAGNAYASAALFHAYDAELLDAEGHYALEGPHAEAAVLRLRSLIDAGVVPDEASGTLVQDLFRSGLAMTAISGPWLAPSLPSDLAWSVRPLPRVESTGRDLVPFSTVEAAMIARGSRHREAAESLAIYLGSVEGSVIRARDGQHIIANAEAWRDPRLSGETRLRGFYEAARAARPMPTHRLMAATFLPAERAIRRVLRGDAEPSVALAEGSHRFLDETREPPPARDPTFALIIVGLLGLVVAGLALKRAADPELRAAIARSRTAYAWVAHAALAVGLLVVLPLFVGALTSFFAEAPGPDGERVARYVGIANYVDILTARGGDLLGHGSFYVVLLVTILWTVVNLVGHLGLGISLALVLSRPSMKLRGLYRVLLVLPWAVPSYVTALAWRGMFHRQLGAVNALLGLFGVEPVSFFSRFSTAFAANVATNVWLGFPFMMVVTLGALTSIPTDVYEAAAVDGANARDRFFKITLPLLLPALLPAVLMGAVWTFNMFNVVFLVSAGEPDGSTEILVSEAYRWAFTRGHQTGYAAAYAVLIFGILVLMSRLSARATREAR